jgi:polar amino acid transport system substrate-binding protein
LFRRKKLGIASMKGDNLVCRSIWFLAAFVAFNAMMVTSPVSANALQDIKSKGFLTCGVLTANPPLGLIDPATRQPAGFDLDICAAIAARIGVKVEVKSVTLESRVAEVALGRIDLASAALAYNKERAEQIAFSSAYYWQPLKVITLAASAINKFSDLKGQKISATKGSTIERYILERIPGVSVINFQDTPSAFLALTQGKVQALGMTNSSGVRYINETGTKYRMLDETLSLEPSAIGMKKGEDALLAAVNDVLEGMDKNGEIEKIWNKWFGPDTGYKIPLGMRLTKISDLER